MADQHNALSTHWLLILKCHALLSVCLLTHSLCLKPLVTKIAFINSELQRPRINEMKWAVIWLKLYKKYWRPQACASAQSNTKKITCFASSCSFWMGILKQTYLKVSCSHAIREKWACGRHMQTTSEQEVRSFGSETSFPPERRCLWFSAGSRRITTLIFPPGGLKGRQPSETLTYRSPK